MFSHSVIGTLISSVINGQQQYKRYVALGMVSVLISSCVMVGLIISANLKGALLAAVLQSGLIGLVMVLGSLRQPWFKLKFCGGVPIKSIGRPSVVISDGGHQRIDGSYLIGFNPQYTG